jgi:sigma-B regulation protein RsbU (phosphoserine phosphatase)
MFVTFFLGVLDLGVNRLTYVRAGHVPPSLRRADGSIERLGHGGGLPLGMMEDTAYVAATVAFNSGDALLVVTDGFTEAHNPAGELYGDERVERYLAALDPRADGALDALIKDVRRFEAGQPASDDMAAVLLTLT